MRSAESGVRSQQSLKLSEFNYILPQERIAQHPLPERDASRLLVLRRYSGVIDHRSFPDILEYLEPGDSLVINDTKVMAARLWGKKPTGGKVEVLLLERRSTTQWTALVRGLYPGQSAEFPEGTSALMTERLSEGPALLEFSQDPGQLMERLGQMPLPPYIHRPPEPEDKHRYQTVYAKHSGSVAAPTAGLHFTEQLLENLKDGGVHVVPLVLHVGWGTFRGIQTDHVKEHIMLPEWYELSETSAQVLKQTKAQHKRLVAVGTSVVRALESIVQKQSQVTADQGWSELFITPGHKFQAVDAMVTNFHLPCMPPLVMTGAFVSDGLPWQEGRDMLFTAYQDALDKGYRFASYGDAMLIL